jgi:hypothetical protein
MSEHSGVTASLLVARSLAAPVRIKLTLNEIGDNERLWLDKIKASTKSPLGRRTIKGVTWPPDDGREIKEVPRMLNWRTAMSVANLKTLIGAAIVLGACVVGAAPASADAGPASAGPNIFGALSCNCREAAPQESPALTQEEVHRGIQAGRRDLRQSAQESQG